MTSYEQTLWRLAFNRKKKGGRQSSLNRVPSTDVVIVYLRPVLDWINQRDCHHCCDFLFVVTVTLEKTVVGDCHTTKINGTVFNELVILLPLKWLLQRWRPDL